MSTKTILSRLLWPGLIAPALVALDQVTKYWIVANIPENTIGMRFMNDFLWIVHSRNLGIAFSIGDDLSRLIRVALFIVLPGVFMILALVFMVRSEKLTSLQRLAIAIIVGGGLGNLIDRIFRPEGVVDFLSFSLYGFLGLDRFFTFNVADTSVTVGACLILLSGFLWDKEAHT
jgi:signal peptidase II